MVTFRLLGTEFENPSSDFGFVFLNTVPSSSFSWFCVRCSFSLYVMMFGFNVIPDPLA